MLNHLISADQFTSLAGLTRLLDKVQPRDRMFGMYKPHLLERKKMVTLFYEPSTRTRLSFEAAMLNLGGHVISTENALQFSSHTKGESLEDTIRVVGEYCDVIVLRHPEVGSAARAAAVSVVPVINAGDGAGEHPTQALLDVYTIRAEVGRLDGLKVVVVGDLKYGRTVHSLLRLLSLAPGLTVFAVSPDTLALPADVIARVEETGGRVVPLLQVYQAIEHAPDVVYMTRVQSERHAAVSKADWWAPHGVLTPELLKRLPDRAVVMHPLPRNSELPPAVDADPRVKIFKQAANGLVVREAILYDMLSNQGPN